MFYYSVNEEKYTVYANFPSKYLDPTKKLADLLDFAREIRE